MATRKREKELARAKYERQQARRQVRGRSQRRLQVGIGIAVAIVVVLGIVALGFANRSTDLATAPDTSASPPASTSATASASDTASTSASASASPTAAPISCTKPGTPRPDDKTYPSAPPVPASLPTTLTLATNCGDIVIALDPKAPTTVSSEAFLASQGFYSSTSCHRLTTNVIYVLQCGDPRGNGTGGPGYTVPDENLPAAGVANYPAGTVAMANAGPGTSGSQFFLVYQDTELPPDYTVWGRITSGLDIVQGVAARGTADPNGDGAPTQPVFIVSATAK